jgi:hypothetical protein
MKPQSEDIETAAMLIFLLISLIDLSLQVI